MSLEESAISGKGLSDDQRSSLEHIHSAYVGPEGGPTETLTNRPHLQYAVGMLFPSVSARNAVDLDIDAPGGVEEGDLEDEPQTLAEDWRPSSVAISFVTDSSEVECQVSGGVYLPDDGVQGWRRTPVALASMVLRAAEPRREFAVGAARFEVGSRWRPYGPGAYLVTAHVRTLSPSTGDDRQDIELMLFQTRLEVRPGADGRILEYDTTRGLNLDHEAQELKLRFRNRRVFAVGHGMAAEWQADGEACNRIWVTPVPAYVVPRIETTSLREGSPAAQALSLDLLARIDSQPDQVLDTLNSFADEFESWVAEEEARATKFKEAASTAERITKRSRRALSRMREGIKTLADPQGSDVRRAFALAMAAMRNQMHQASILRKDPQSPRWRPFQLGFILVSLASMADEAHADRDLVDLIWFPTGGGKTEAYLGLAAFEAFRRRIAHGVKGGGTAVITRYTLRLLTAQQFQRAAAMVCAMELLRRSDPRAEGMMPFTIGLWVGNEVTPSTNADAVLELKRLLASAAPRETNKFQVESCPWCQVPLVPLRRKSDPRAYGFRIEGGSVVLHCTDSACPFQTELPMAVVDEVLYENPPTVLLSTVDKFARLQFKPEAGKLLGLNTIFKQPSLVIQDELHLLSGPLGTTVAVFDAVIQLLLKRYGSSPKIVASTATIRASDDQVRGLYGRGVALYPPSGLDEDRTFFSKVASDGSGRLYLGLMPQSASQATALIHASAPLVEIPSVLPPGSKDAYWTLVMYHNSLRELGRSSALLLDDVNDRLEARSERLGIAHRGVRAGAVVELTSHKGPEELPGELRALETSIEDSTDAIDAVLSSNMLSVGIDVPRLALMLMVGQPKTSAEYIQATSRVGRGRAGGIVVTLFRSNRARDRSYFETFLGYHQALYRNVEPTSVTPWSLSSRSRSLAGALVALVRHTIPGLADDPMRMDLSDSVIKDQVANATSALVRRVHLSDQEEAREAESALTELVKDWDWRVREARRDGLQLRYERTQKQKDALLKRFGEDGAGWLVGDSMRSVEPNVAIEVEEPNEGRRGAKD